MAEFCVIAGSGHCGTKWLASVLSEDPAWVWRHELRAQVTGLPWWKADAFAPGHAVFDHYWVQIQNAAGNLGDANSWHPIDLPAVNDIHPISRVIYLVRDKVQQLHSLMTRSPAWCAADWPAMAKRRLWQLWQAAGEPLKHWALWTREERLCLLVRANDFVPAWLTERGLRVDVFDLDQLLSGDVGQDLIPGPRLAAYCDRDMNRKVYGNRRPSYLWQQWTSQMREAFEAVAEVK